MRSDHYGLQREEARQDHALIPGEAGIALDPRLGWQTRALRQRRDRDEYPSGDGNPLRDPSLSRPALRHLLHPDRAERRPARVARLSPCIAIGPVWAAR